MYSHVAMLCRCWLFPLRGSPYISEDISFNLSYFISLFQSLIKYDLACAKKKELNMNLISAAKLWNILQFKLTWTVNEIPSNFVIGFHPVSSFRMGIQWRSSLYFSHYLFVRLPLFLIDSVRLLVPGGLSISLFLHVAIVVYGPKTYNVTTLTQRYSIICPMTSTMKLTFNA